MFAIIRVGGKQYRVENGTQILVDRLHVDEGKAVEGVEVLMLANGDDIQIGAPVVEGIAVGAIAVKHTLGKKIRVFKYKAKKNYRRRIGSRPHQTLLRIESIGGNSERNAPAAPARKAAPVAVESPIAVEEMAPVEAPVAVEAMAPIAMEAPVEAEAMAPVAVEETAPIAMEAPVETETPAVVEAVAVVDADAEDEVVAAIEEMPGVESVEIIESPENETA